MSFYLKKLSKKNKVRRRKKIIKLIAKVSEMNVTIFKVNEINKNLNGMMGVGGEREETQI